MAGNVDSILVGLNDAQRAAVMSPSPVLQILAPPGSGKTKTLTSRVAYLLKHYKYQPWNIICVTFTIKAAREMKARVAKLVGPTIGNNIILGTFHSVCLRYLSVYGSKIGIRKGFAIANSSDSKAIIKRIIQRLGIKITPNEKDGRAKAERDKISKAKSMSQGFEHFRHEAEEKKAKGEMLETEDQEFITIFEEYEAELKRLNMMDFDDLLLNCVKLLKEHPRCVSNVEAVLVDEFQDTNVVQYELMNHLASTNKRITIVGDPDQSIYSWRSAEVENLSRMQEKHPNTQVSNLEENYRSTGSILNFALTVIQQDESRHQKSLVATHCLGTKPTLQRLSSFSAQAEWIAEEICRSIKLCGDKLLGYSDFAILMRTTKSAWTRDIENALNSKKIPYRMIGGSRFYDQEEIKILLNYMRVISQPGNDEALIGIINKPKRGVGETIQWKMVHEAGTRNKSLYAVIKEVAQGSQSFTMRSTSLMRDNLSKLLSMITELRRELLNANATALYSPQTLLESILERIGFEQYLRDVHRESFGKRWNSVQELVAQAREYSIKPEESNDEIQGNSLPIIEGIQQERDNSSVAVLAKFLTGITLITDSDRDQELEEGATAKTPEKRVTISTIHGAKGLEWPVVFIPYAHKGLIPHSKSVSKEEEAEERRLLYVAITRAKALLYLSWPKHGKSGENFVSPFLEPKDVAAHLSDQGPYFQISKTVYDIANTLHRECPPQGTLNRSFREYGNAEDSYNHMEYPFDSNEAERVAEKSLVRTYQQSWTSPLFKRVRYLSIDELGDTLVEGSGSQMSPYVID